MPDDEHSMKDEPLSHNNGTSPKEVEDRVAENDL